MFWLFVIACVGSLVNRFMAWLGPDDADALKEHRDAAWRSVRR
jgi:hypothetical protein